jgi:hypothetical protein
MLPRRHILDVCEFVRSKEDLLPMCTVTLAVDAIKHLDPKYKKDHLVEALELNEFICYMYPVMRPRNRSLLMHVVSDLLGLLLYGVPEKTKPSIKNLEIVNYSKENMEIYPVIEVWNTLKDKVYVKKHGAAAIIQGFVQKIRVEADVMERFPQVEEIFEETRTHLKAWLPCLASYYDKPSKSVRNIFNEWWDLWGCGQGTEKALLSMVDRLALQAESEYSITIDKEKILREIHSDPQANAAENRQFSKWYKEGVNLLMKI